jgi:hypothetical protein
MLKGLRVQADTTGTFDVQRYSEESEMFSDVSGPSKDHRVSMPWLMLRLSADRLSILGCFLGSFSANSSADTLGIRGFQQAFRSLMIIRGRLCIFGAGGIP